MDISRALDIQCINYAMLHHSVCYFRLHFVVDCELTSFVPCCPVRTLTYILRERERENERHVIGLLNTQSMFNCLMGLWLMYNPLSPSLASLSFPWITWQFTKVIVRLTSSFLLMVLRSPRCSYPLRLLATSAPAAAAAERSVACPVCDRRRVRMWLLDSDFSYRRPCWSPQIVAYLGGCSEDRSLAVISGNNVLECILLSSVVVVCLSRHTGRWEWQESAVWRPLSKPVRAGYGGGGADGGGCWKIPWVQCILSVRFLWFLGYIIQEIVDVVCMVCMVCSWHVCVFVCVCVCVDGVYTYVTPIVFTFVSRTRSDVQDKTALAATYIPYTDTGIAFLSLACLPKESYLSCMHLPGKKHLSGKNILQSLFI